MEAEPSSEVVPAVDAETSDATERPGTRNADRKRGAARDNAAPEANAAGGPEAPPVRRMLAGGGIESIDHRHILGWAWYRPTPDYSIDVEVLVDDVVVMKTRAGLD